MDETSVPATAQPKRRRTVLIVVVAAVVVAAAAVGGWIWVDNATSGPQARSGEFVSDSTPGIVDPSKVTLRVPWGTIDVTTGRPLDRIPSSILYSSRFKTTYDKIEAPDGGRWVATEVAPAVSLEGDLVRSSPDAGIPATRISLVSGDHVLPVAKSAGSKNPTGSGADIGSLFVGDVGGYVAVPDSGDHLRVRIEFGGVRQEIGVDGSRPAYGAAAPLYQTQPDFTQALCSKGSIDGYRIGFVIPDGCKMDRLDAMPYVAGLGWAKPGRSWLVTTFRALAPAELFRKGRSETAGHYYALRGDDSDAKSTLTYGSQTAAATVRYNLVETQFGVAVDDPTLFVFDVPAKDTGRSATFTLTTRFTAVRARAGYDGPASSGVHLTVVRTVAVRS